MTLRPGQAAWAAGTEVVVERSGVSAAKELQRVAARYRIIGQQHGLLGQGLGYEKRVERVTLQHGQADKR